MFASIRKYTTTSPDEVTRKVIEEFVPLISKFPGFLSYSCINAGNGDYASVSVFETREQAEQSNAEAAKWVAASLANLIRGAAQVMAGEVTVRTER